jgi:undecaprenyl-diphosphatase
MGCHDCVPGRAALGAVFHDFIKTVLFSPWVVVTTLILGGIAILALERLAPKPRHRDIETLPLRTAIRIGFLPGGCLDSCRISGRCYHLGGRDAGRRSPHRTEFSFYLAIPTMLAATAFDLWKNRSMLSASGSYLIAIGFVTAFLVAIPAYVV